MNFHALSLKAPQNCAMSSPRNGRAGCGEESDCGSIGASFGLAKHKGLSTAIRSVCRNRRNDSITYCGGAGSACPTGSPSSAMMRKALVVGQGPGLRR